MSPSSDNLPGTRSEKRIARAHAEAAQISPEERDPAPAVALRRLYSQRIEGTAPTHPGEVVRWLGAVQAQDYLGALWALGLRTRGAVEADVERAIADRRVVRTWPMRGTLHFVPAEDVRWMLALLTPRVIAASAGRYGQLELHEEVFARSEKLIVGALEGGKQLSRSALYRMLEGAGIGTAGSRGLHILARLAQRGVICFGAREGKQPTFALLEEWVPAARSLSGEEALAELTRRYFRGHGPATLHDFAWWSGLRMSEAKSAVGMLGSELDREVVGERTLHSAARAAIEPETRAHGGAHLLPPFDEFTVAYRDRRDVLDPWHAARVAAGGMLSPTVVIDGRVVGTWRRALRKEEVRVTLEPFAPLNKAQKVAVSEAAQRYAAFLGLEGFLA